MALTGHPLAGAKYSVNPNFFQESWLPNGRLPGDRLMAAKTDLLLALAWLMAAKTDLLLALALPKMLRNEIMLRTPIIKAAHLV